MQKQWKKLTEENNLAHDIIIILDVIDTLIGTGCSTSLFMDLREAVENAEFYLTNSETSPDPLGDELHETLEELQVFLVNGCEMTDGLVGTVIDYTDKLNDSLS